MNKYTNKEIEGEDKGAQTSNSVDPGATQLPDFRFSMGKQSLRELPGGTAREVTAREFPVSQNIAAVLMTLKPGGLRELHWHANAAEWAYVIEGNVRVTIVDTQGRLEIADFGRGDIWYFPRGHVHSIQGLGPGSTVAKFLLVFDNGYFSEFSTFSVSDWLAQTPKGIVAKNLNLSPEELRTAYRRSLYSAGTHATDPSGRFSLWFRNGSCPTVDTQVSASVAKALRKIRSRRGSSRLCSRISYFYYHDRRTDESSPWRIARTTLASKCR
jgi:oxalate decarboxylase family bicupin protein